MTINCFVFITKCNVNVIGIFLIETMKYSLIDHLILKV